MSKKSSKATIEARRAKVAQLILSGVNYRTMAEKLSCSLGTIARDVDALMKEWAKDQKPDDRDKWRTLEMAKLERMEFAIAQQIISGNQGAIDRALRIMERRAKLLGLDAPVKQTNDNSGEIVFRVVRDG